MKLTILILFIVLSLPRAYAAAWELCLDQSDFDLNAGSIMRSTKVSKAGCRMKFVEFGAKGDKYEINLCNPQTSILSFGSIDSEQAEKLMAGSAGCPMPLFGAEFDLKENEVDGEKYKKAKAKVNQIFDSVYKMYEANASKVDLNKITTFSNASPDVKIVCAKRLLDDYLNQCLAFEEKKNDGKKNNMDPKNLPAGVHPAEIKK